MTIALEKAKIDDDEFTVDMIEFYLAIISRKVLKQRHKLNKDLTDDEKIEMMAINKIIEDKADKRLPQALYSYGQDLYQWVLSPRGQTLNNKIKF